MGSRINIGLVGFGCVGQALYDVVSTESLPLDITRICVKDKEKRRNIDADNFTFRYLGLNRRFRYRSNSGIDR